MLLDAVILPNTNIPVVSLPKRPDVPYPAPLRMFEKSLSSEPSSSIALPPFELVRLMILFVTVFADPPITITLAFPTIVNPEMVTLLQQCLFPHHKDQFE